MAAEVGPIGDVFLFVCKARARIAAGKVVTWLKKRLVESFRPLPIVTGLIGDVFRSRQELVAENMMLRQQRIVALRKVSKPLHDVLLTKVAKRVDDDDIMRLLKMILNASGKRGVPQGGVISPMLSHLYLDEVDRMLERAKEVTRRDKWDALQYARFADDLVVLVDLHPRHRWLRRAVSHVAQGARKQRKPSYWFRRAGSSE